MYCLEGPFKIIVLGQIVYAVKAAYNRAHRAVKLKGTHILKQIKYLVYLVQILVVVAVACH